MKRMLLSLLAIALVASFNVPRADAGPLRRVGATVVRVVTFGRRGCHARHASAASQACSTSACAPAACASSTTELAVPPPPY